MSFYDRTRGHLHENRIEDLERRGDLSGALREALRANDRASAMRVVRALLEEGELLQINGRYWDELPFYSGSLRKLLSPGKASIAGSSFPVQISREDLLEWAVECAEDALRAFERDTGDRVLRSGLHAAAAGNWDLALQVRYDYHNRLLDGEWSGSQEAAVTAVLDAIWLQRPGTSRLEIPNLAWSIAKSVRRAAPGPSGTLQASRLLDRILQ